MNSVRLFAAAIAVLGLAAVSLFVGVGEVSLGSLLTGGEQEEELLLLLASRIPRTIALVLAGCSMSTAGLIMQMLARNRFVEPSTIGTVESARLGVLVTMVFAPGLPIIGRMLVAALFALAGTALFLAILRRIPLRSALVVPLIGIMLGGMIGAITTFFAYRYDLIQSLAAWASGDFSSVLRGRYELLWVAGGLSIVCYIAADRFSIAGLGRGFATNLGLSYRKVVSLGLIIVSMVTATVVTTVGVIPFLGLIVPNLVSLAIGDNVRRAIPWIAIAGSLLVLACDILGRLVRFPYEIPVGVILGVVGSLTFLSLLLRKEARHA